ncbi:MAG: DctP family TRAP transporter solute-binding subunit [Spirochaetes bacterium]|nr:DctP family TRAP transporter solute-binding subunit [Spirochaetota bacterium]
MTKKIFILFVALVMLASFTFATGQAEKGKQAAPKKIKIVWSSVSVPNDAHTKAMYVFKNTLEKLTNGQVEVSIFPSGQLFTQEAAQAAIRKGTLDMVYTGPNWLAQYVPYMSMFAAAYMFKDYNHMTKTFNGPIGKKIFADIAKKTGVRPLGAFYLGTRELDLRDIGRVVRTPADMKGVKLRMPNTPTWLFMGKALGANPTPLSFTEVYLALKTGTIDGQDNPLPTDKNAKFYEVTKYIILTDHYINPIFPTINEKKWESLSPDIQAKVYKAVEAARKVCDDTNLKAESELLAFFKSKGMVIVKPDKEAFIKYAQKMYLDNKQISGSWNMKLFKEVQALGK